MTGRLPVCAECGHGHAPDAGCADHPWTDACPWYGLDCASLEERDRITTRVIEAYEGIGELADRLEVSMTEPRQPPAGKSWLEVEGEGEHGWLTAARVVEAIRRIGETGVTVRTEPIKLTAGQWAVIQAANPPLADQPINPLYRPLGDLMGIPVVMVTDESQSTPVVEGWVKGPSKPTHKLDSGSFVCMAAARKPRRGEDGDPCEMRGMTCYRCEVTPPPDPHRPRRWWQRLWKWR